MINLSAQANNYPLLTVGDIHAFLDEANSLVKPQNEMASDLLRQRMSEMKDMIQDCQEREEKFYGKFNVSNISELQEEIDKVMKELGNFSNKALRAMPLVQAMQKDTNSITNLSEKLEQEINRFAQTSSIIQDASQEKAEELIVKHLATLFNGIPNAPSVSELRASFESKKRTTKKGKYKVKKGAIKDYKKEFEIAFEGHSTVDGVVFNFSTEFDENALMNGSTTNLTSYPYYKLDAEQKKMALENDSLWRAFVFKISSMAGSYSGVVSKIMNTPGLIYRSDFFINSDSELIGVLGELQVLTIFQALSNRVPDQSFIDYLGNALKGGKKISVDVLVNGEGIQVKNYNTYGIRDLNEGFNLSKTVSLDYFLNQLRGRLGGDVATLAEFYTIRAYHTKVTDQYGPTLERLHVFDDRVKDFFQAYVSELLPMDDVEGAMREGRTIANASNLFFFVSGRLVPISKILLSYYKYMELLQQQLSVQARRTLTVTPLYGNTDTYASYWNAKNNGEGEQYKQNFSYENIYRQLSVRYNININIDYVLEEILYRE